ncbi:hypothetical protein, partial [Streptococcus suis]|uniref:hypothetical protein n=2 Tax=Streptococcus suis TaxID=1307 RepID=UPI00077CBA42
MLEHVYCSIDRLTMLALVEEPRKVIHKIRQYLEKNLDKYKNIAINDFQDMAFGVAWYEPNEAKDGFREENLVFLHLFEHAGKTDLRIDFNPNSLKKRGSEQVWGDIRYVLSVFKADLRLSRFDLAFDIFNAPEIAEMRNLKGGITRKEFYGRSGALETVYWGSQASSVQIRLYNKLVELGGNMSSYDYRRISETNSYGAYVVQIRDFWRLELQLRTKVIDENMVSECLKRLDDFTFASAYALNLEPKLKRFADLMMNEPGKLKLAYSEVDERTIRRWKTKVRKAVAEVHDDYVCSIKKALQRDSAMLQE